MSSADIRDPQTYSIIGAGMEVHGEMGCGFLEHAYKEAMVIELTLRGIPHQREVLIPIFYKGRKLECTYRADLICFGEVIVELKAVKQLTAVDRAQVINYLKATGLHVALLINFGATSLEFERIVLTHPSSIKSNESV